MAETVKQEAPAFSDDFGILEVFAVHLELALETMSPDQAFEAAQHSTRAYLKSWDFVPISTKQGGSVQYYKRPKQPRGSDAMK